MKSKYNIALVPKSNSDQIITLSQKFKDIAEQYLLGEYSLPHVTICQFMANQDEAEDIWIKVCDLVNQKTINLTFKEFSCLTFNSSVFWVSLLPDNCEKLIEMNRIVSGSIINSISKSNADYDPHMTLVNSKNKEYKIIAEKVAKSYKPISDEFILSLGKSDDIGQYTKIIYKWEIKPSMGCGL